MFVLGKGSNVLVSDKGIKGAVIFTGKQCGITLTDEIPFAPRAARASLSFAPLRSKIRSRVSNLPMAYPEPSAARCS